MRIQCPNCPAAYELDDGRVPPAGLSIKCPKCKTPFTVQRPKPGEGKAAGQKVPLPGTGAPSAPAAKPWTPRAAAPGKPQGPKGAVPLPGMQGFGGATPAPRAMPTPGQGSALAPPPPGLDPFAPPAAGAVPLPGLDEELPAPQGAPRGQSDLDAAFAPPSPDLEAPGDDAFPVPDDTALTPKRAVQETDLAPKQFGEPGDLPAPSPEEDAPSFDFVEPGPAPRATASSFKVRHLVLLLLLAAVGGAVAMGIRAGKTPSGLFWQNDLLAVSRPKPSATTLAVVAAGQAKLGQGTFSSEREVLGTAAQLLGSAPNDDDARSFFVLCAAELKVGYGQGGADWDQAKRVVERIRGKAPAHNRARGAFALAVGDTTKARQLLSTLAETDPESAWLFSQTLLRANDVDRAAQVLDQALKRQSAPSPKLLIARGIAAKAQGAPANAAGFFEKALDVQPEHGRALVELADVKLLQNDPQQAAQLLDKALAEGARKTLDASEEARAAMLRGRLLVSQHHAKDAEVAFERAVQLDPNSAEVHAVYGSFRLQRREYDKAQKQLEAALVLDPANPRVLADLARAYLGTNRLLEADKRIQEALAKAPSDPMVLYAQGKVAEAIGKQEDAYKAYDKALQKKPDLAEAFLAQGSIWFSRGDKQKAREKLDAVLKTPSRTAREEEAAGDLALDLGDGKTGKECYQRALHLDPEDPQAHSGLGRAFAAVGDLPAARAELEAALRQVDTDPVLHYEYGSLLHRDRKSVV